VRFGHQTLRLAPQQPDHGQGCLGGRAAGVVGCECGRLQGERFAGGFEPFVNTMAASLIRMCITCLCNHKAMIRWPCVVHCVMNSAWCSGKIEHRRSCTHGPGCLSVHATQHVVLAVDVQKGLGGVQDAATRAAILTQHNSLRNEYGAGQLTWSVRVAHAAQVRTTAVTRAHWC
jgi:hypothetical protein